MLNGLFLFVAFAVYAASVQVHMYVYILCLSVMIMFPYCIVSAVGTLMYRVYGYGMHRSMCMYGLSLST